MTNEQAIKSLKTIKTYTAAGLLEVVDYVIKVLEKLEEGKDVLLIIEVEGALKIKNLFPESVCIFILPPSMKELQQRLIVRGTEDKEKVINSIRRNLSYSTVDASDASTTSSAFDDANKPIKK